MRNFSALRHFVLLAVPLFVVLLCYNFLVNNQKLLPAIYYQAYQLNYCGDQSEINNKNRETLSITRCSCVNNANKLTGSRMSAMSLELFDYMSAHLRETPYPGVVNYTNYIAARMNLKPLKVVKQPKSSSAEFSPVFNDVKSFQFTTSPASCGDGSPSERAAGEVLSVFIAAVSSPNNFEKRNAIRHTWLLQLDDELNIMKSQEEPLIKVIGKAFVIGQSTDSTMNDAVTSESATYNDIISVDMVDSYYNLSVKAVGLLNWLVNKCSNVDYVLKADDDVYVNTRKLGGFIRQLNISDLSIYGTVTDGIVLREGKWGLPYECYPWNTYPRYYQGAAVLMAGKAVVPLLSAAQTIPYHPIDDLYLTGFCTEKAGVSLLSTYSFFDRLARDEVPGACRVLLTVTWLLQSTDQMRSSHDAVRDAYHNVTQCLRFDGSQVDPSENVFNPLTRV